MHGVVRPWRFFHSFEKQYQISRRRHQLVSLVTCSARELVIIDEWLFIEFILIQDTNINVVLSKGMAMLLLCIMLHLLEVVHIRNARGSDFITKGIPSINSSNFSVCLQL